MAEAQPNEEAPIKDDMQRQKDQQQREPGKPLPKDGEEKR